MKKIVILVISAIMIIMVGVILYRIYVNQKEDVILESVDGYVSFGFEKITSERRWKNGDNRISFKIDEETNFYDDYIKGMPDFVAFIDENNNIVDKKTSKYLFCKEEHYFYVVHNKNVVTIYELTSGFYASTDDYNVYLPYYEALAYAQENVLKYDELIGVKSYEDLIKFYERIDDDSYYIDEENSIIYLSLYNGVRNIEKGAVVEIEEDGIKVTLLEKYQ